MSDYARRISACEDGPLRCELFSRNRNILPLSGSFQQRNELQPIRAQRYSRNDDHKSDSQPDGRPIDHQQKFGSWKVHSQGRSNAR